MRKLIILSPSIIGGSWNMFKRFINYIYKNYSNSNIKVTVIALGNKNHLQDISPVEYHIIKWFDHNRYVHILERNIILNILFYIPLFIDSIFYWIKNRNIEYIFSNGILSATPFIFLKTFIHSYKLYCWIHADSRISMNRIYLNVIRRWSRYIDKFFVNSLDVFTDLTRCGISKEKITIVNNWVEPIVMDEDNIKHLNEKYRYLLNYKFRVIYVGRLVEYKHVLTYANVASRLANNFIAFIFVGYGELSGLIEKIKNCNSNIFWLSNISNEELRYLMSISNITLAYADENYLGLTAYESLMCGTPVIYIDISCSPAKYFKKIKIEKELLPTHIGYKVGEKEDDICNLITLLYELNKPTIKEREECKIYATKFHSEKNAEILLNETLKYPIGSIE